MYTKADDSKSGRRILGHVLCTVYMDARVEISEGPIGYLPQDDIDNHEVHAVNGQEQHVAIALVDRAGTREKPFWMSSPHCPSITRSLLDQFSSGRGAIGAKFHALLHR